MADELQLTGAQAVQLKRATTATSAQIRLVDDLLVEMDVNLSPANRLAMLQVLATNFLAERTKT